MKRAKHNLSHYRITAGDFGYLYPYSCTEVLPGDTFRCSASALVRTQPLVTPLMHPVDISIAHFFVPNRLTWSGWEDWITGKNEVEPPIVAGPTSATGIDDYMGLPPDSETVSGFPRRAYNKIWNEFYRDQDLQSEVAEQQDNPLRVAWQKDYFTTARSSPQQGEAVGASITFADNIPLSGLGMGLSRPGPQNNQTVTESNGLNTTYDNAWLSSVSNSELYVQATGAGSGSKPNMRIDAGTAIGTVDINEWRRSVALQRFREHRNKFGSRYKDMLAYLGVNSPDARLDRPEYLGGGRQTIAFSEVLQTVESESVPLGAQAGHGIASISTRPWKKMFLEHGLVISLMSIRPKNIYMTGADRTYVRRRTRDDYWQKENEILGEQDINNEEIYPVGRSGSSAGTFGYAPRHDEYRTQRSYATGQMRDQEYNTWHMGRDFSSNPALNPGFIECDPTNRVFASTNDPQFYAMIQNRISARRLVRKYAAN